MSLLLYYASGSPYAWRVWLALEHKGIPYEMKLLSFDAGDLATPEFRALNPRQKVPVIVDDGFALAESAAIVEYLDERWPDVPRLFAADLRRRALQRRLVREADAYVAPAVEALAEAVLATPPETRSGERIAAAAAALGTELAFWEAALGGDFLAGDVSAADLTLYPFLALARRVAGRVDEALFPDGPRVSAWMSRIEALPATRKTWPPHWR